MKRKLIVRIVTGERDEWVLGEGETFDVTDGELIVRNSMDPAEVVIVYPAGAWITLIVSEA